MYLVGETFSFDIDDDTIEFICVAETMIKGEEFLICENDENGEKRVFVYNEEIGDLELLDSEEEEEEILSAWEEENYGDSNKTYWDEDGEEYEEEEEEEEEEEIENHFFDEEEEEEFIESLVDKILE